MWRSAGAWGWGSGPGSGAAAEPRGLLQEMGLLPGVLQAVSRPDGQTDRQRSGSCILSAYVASVRDAEQTLRFSQAEHLVPQ